jgi:hypothetical protein
MTKKDVTVLRNRILKGIGLSFKQLLIEKQKSDGDIVISRNGQIMKIKAKEFEIKK